MQKLEGGSGRRWGLGSRRVTAGAHVECLVRRASGAAMDEPLALAEVLHPESPIGGRRRAGDESFELIETRARFRLIVVTPNGCVGETAGGEQCAQSDASRQLIDMCDLGRDGERRRTEWPLVPRERGGDVESALTEATHAVIVICEITFELGAVLKYR